MTLFASDYFFNMPNVRKSFASDYFFNMSNVRKSTFIVLWSFNTAFESKLLNVKKIEDNSTLESGHRVFDTKLYM